MAQGLNQATIILVLVTMAYVYVASNILSTLQILTHLILIILYGLINWH